MQSEVNALPEILLPRKTRTFRGLPFAEGSPPRGFPLGGVQVRARGGAACLLARRGHGEEGIQLHEHEREVEGPLGRRRP